MASSFTYAFSVSISSTPIKTSRKYPKISSNPSTGMRSRRLQDLLPDQYTQMNRRENHYHDEHPRECHYGELLGCGQRSFYDHQKVSISLRTTKPSQAIAIVDESGMPPLRPRQTPSLPAPYTPVNWQKYMSCIGILRVLDCVRMQYLFSYVGYRWQSCPWRKVTSWRSKASLPWRYRDACSVFSFAALRWNRCPLSPVVADDHAARSTDHAGYQNCLLSDNNESIHTPARPLRP